MMENEYSKQSMGRSTQSDIDRMAREGGENELRGSADAMKIKRQLDRKVTKTARKNKR